MEQHPQHQRIYFIAQRRLERRMETDIRRGNWGLASSSLYFYDTRESRITLYLSAQLAYLVQQH